MPGWNPGRYAKKTKNAYHWPWKSDGGHSTTRTFVKGLGLFLLIFLLAGVLFNQSQPSIRVYADYNTSYSHTRATIYQENTGNWDSSRWSFNSTCVTFVGQAIRFDYSTGSSGSGGNNCNSADIAINKSPISLATVSAKQLEMDFEWAANAGGGCTSTCYKRAIITFRTNATVPNFKENYDPFLDTKNQLIFDTCPILNAGLCGANGGAVLYVQHDAAKSINAEGGANDGVGSVLLPGSGSAGTVMNLQVVLNYTGPTHFFAYKESLGGSTSNVATGPLASYLVPGNDYYILLMGLFNTNVTPSGTINWAFDMGSHNIVSAPDAFGIWSTPAACEDPLNKAACAAAPPAGYSAPSTSNLSLFNPVSWIVYLGKVMIWAGQQALALVINGSAYFFQLWNGVAASIGPILQSIWSIIAGFFWGIIVGTLNTVGSLLGFPSLGTTLGTALTNFFSLLFGANGIFNAILIGIGDLANLVKNFALFFYAGFFFDFVVPLVTLFGLLFNLLAVTLKVLGLLFKGGTIGIQFLFLFDILWVLLGVNDEGTGFIVKEWWPLHKLIIVGIVQVGEFFLRMISQYIYWVVTVVELAIEDVKPNVSVSAG